MFARGERGVDLLALRCDAMSRLRRSLAGRLGRNLAAQLYNQTATLLIQLVLIPVLIFAWGIETYGVWLVLTALAAYLALSDLGLTFVAKNEMAMQAAAGDRENAVATFHSVFARRMVLLAIVAVCTSALVWSRPLGAMFAPRR